MISSLSVPGEPAPALAAIAAAGWEEVELSEPHMAAGPGALLRARLRAPVVGPGEAGDAGFLEAAATLGADVALVRPAPVPVLIAAAERAAALGLRVAVLPSPWSDDAPDASAAAALVAAAGHDALGLAFNARLEMGRGARPRPSPRSRWIGSGMCS